MDSDRGKLFVGGIPWETTEDRLKEYFGAYGEVVDVVIMKDRVTGRARGFGFVAFADPSVADTVMLEKHSIDGRPVETKKAVPREEQQQGMPRGGGGGGGGVRGQQQIRTKKIFVGGLASTVTEDDFRTYFEQFGNITDVVVMYDHSTQRHRGFGFITFDAEDSVDRVLHQTFHQLNEKTVEVKRAVPKDQSVPSSHGGGGGPMGPIGGRGGGGYNGGGGSYGQPNFGGPRPPPPSGRGGGGGYPSYGYPPSGYGVGSGYPPAMNAGGGYGGVAPYGNVAPSMPGPRNPWVTGGNNNNNNSGVGFSTGGSPANYGAPGGGGGYGGGGQSNVAGYGYGSADPSKPYGSAPTGYGAQVGGGYGNSGMAPNAGYGGDAYGNYGDTSGGVGGAPGGNYGSAPDGSNYGGGYSAAGKQTQRGGGPDTRFRPYPSTG